MSGRQADWMFAQHELLMNAGYDISQKFEEKEKEFELKEKIFEMRSEYYGLLHVMYTALHVYDLHVNVIMYSTCVCIIQYSNDCLFL